MFSLKRPAVNKKVFLQRDNIEKENIMMRQIVIDIQYRVVVRSMVYTEEMMGMF